ncbi:MAG: DUF58 domain-containing protein [Alphaproteobacteria bacterium]|nr:DUF58 domain-containing protein [Alphaproteobacteria bacterium]
MTATERRLNLQSQAARISGSLPPLLLAAERVATTVAQGVHGRRRVGQGETFWQFRRYETGDSANAIDWRQSAKSQHLFVRETEWEAAQSSWLWRDASPSMHYRSNDSLPTKAERADLLLLATALLLMRAGERFTLLGSALRSASGRVAYDRLADVMVRETPVEDSLPPYRPLPRYAQTILFGDFLSPSEEIGERLSAFAARGVNGLFLQILDPAERSLPFRGRIRFEGFENEGETILGRVQSAREAYKTKFARHCDDLREIARRTGWMYLQHTTDHSAEAALLTLYTALTPRRWEG